MANFPQLTEEDFQQFDSALNELLAKSEASTILIVEKAGHLIHQCGTISGGADQLATLAANSFAATQFMAGLSGEPNFTGMFQQGEKISTLIMNIEEHCILVILFNSSLGVGLIKHYAASTIQRVAAQLAIAQARTPGVVFDLTDLNVTDAGALFRKMETADPAPAESAPAPAAPPVICQKKPMVETVFPGTYWWCACGRSKSQPYCDGSHEGTGWKPHQVEVTETRQIAWCACKHSQMPPFCDGTHSKLP